YIYGGIWAPPPTGLSPVGTAASFAARAEWIRTTGSACSNGSSRSLSVPLSPLAPVSADGENETGREPPMSISNQRDRQFESTPLRQAVCDVADSPRPRAKSPRMRGFRSRRFKSPLSAKFLTLLASSIVIKPLSKRLGGRRPDRTGLV